MILCNIFYFFYCCKILWLKNWNDLRHNANISFAWLQLLMGICKQLIWLTIDRVVGHANYKSNNSSLITNWPHKRDCVTFCLQTVTKIHFRIHHSLPAVGNNIFVRLCQKNNLHIISAQTLSIICSVYSNWKCLAIYIFGQGKKL